MLRRTFLVGALAPIAARAIAQNSFPTPGGASIPGIVPMCLSSNVAVPCNLTTWSVADAATSGLTLSNGNLTVVGPSASVWGSCRATASRTAGKFYVEYYCAVTQINTSYLVMGFASASFMVANYLGTSNYSGGAASSGFYVSGFTNTGGTDFPSAIMVVGDIVQLAIDFGAGAIWFGKNNTWIYGNPGIGTTPSLTFIPATVGALFPAISLLGNSGGGAWTLQSARASQTYAPPSGFTAWG